MDPVYRVGGGLPQAVIAVIEACYPVFRVKNVPPQNGAILWIQNC